MPQEEKIDFLELHKQQLQHNGFWREIAKESVFRAIENTHKTEIITDYFISDITITDKNFLVHWDKRLEPLSKQELKDNYNR